MKEHATEEHLNESILNEEILEDQEEEFRKKIRFFRLNEGTRTTPLNYGFSHAWGKYAAVFDDDDILFSNWVEEFKKCAEENEGRILHSFAFAQDWENLEKLGYCAVAAPSANYCVPFNLINQLSVNRCPLMTLAFPVNIFQKAGIIFNESLNVTEDWEYFMRTAFYAAFPILKHRQQSTDSGKTLKHLPPCMIRKIGMQRIILYKRLTTVRILFCRQEISEES